MLTGLLQVALLLAADPLYGEIDGGCQKGWFGENCSSMCHCQYSADCDRRGECAGDSSCMHPYFGAGCQYDHLHNFTVTLNSVDVCYNERRFQLSDTELDVTCDTTILLQKIELLGPLAHSLCSVRITAGRNVAIKQETAQSSNLFPIYLPKGQSFKAVDGGTDSLFDNETCAHTKNEEKGPWWFLTFNRPQIVFSVFIAGMQEATTATLHGFILELLNEHGNLTEQYIDPNTFAPMYQVMLKSRQLVRHLRIIRPPVFGMTDLSLSLCEVTVYGETICPDGKYGMYCSENCTCADDEICNLINGLCAPGCEGGKYGFNCSMSCSDLCYEGRCRNRYGECIQCVAGLTGDHCDKECLPGTYGLNCAKTCSFHCVDVCQAQTGACSCGDQFSQPLCEDCAPGYYGENCTLKCPTTCEKKMCHKDTGFCESCQGGRMGRYCEECPNNYYGSLCYTKCSSFCMNGTCDQHNGSCPMCVAGYSGPQCVIAPPSELNWGLLITLPIIAAIVAVCTILLLLKRPRQPAEDYSSTVSGESVQPETSTPMSPLRKSRSFKVPSDNRTINSE